MNHQAFIGFHQRSGAQTSASDATSHRVQRRESGGRSGRNTGVGGVASLTAQGALGGSTTGSDLAFPLLFGIGSGLCQKDLLNPGLDVGPGAGPTDLTEDVHAFLLQFQGVPRRRIGLMNHHCGHCGLLGSKRGLKCLGMFQAPCSPCITVSDHWWPGTWRDILFLFQVWQTLVEEVVFQELLRCLLVWCEVGPAEPSAPPRTMACHADAGRPRLASGP
mmetsp:Transcript_48241/g.105287  ORF Transcript_48241/g.105287 Transcript_48241/m.105287 type:complete len:219 (+) Transcript_48241:518-1174(+)